MSKPHKDAFEEGFKAGYAMGWAETNTRFVESVGKRLYLSEKRARALLDLTYTEMTEYAALIQKKDEQK